MISAIIPHFYNKEREKNLQPIVDSLKGIETLIWNNDEPIGPVYGALVHQSMYNLGCQGRFAAVPYLQKNLLGKPDYVLFHDNDLITWPGSVEHLLETAKRYPGDIVTLTGEHRSYRGKRIPISRGRFELVPMSTLEILLHNWPCDKSSEHDDIWLSVRAHTLDVGIHFQKARWKNLKDDVGFWRSLGGPRAWESARQQVFTTLMKENE